MLTVADGMEWHRSMVRYSTEDEHSCEECAEHQRQVHKYRKKECDTHAEAFVRARMYLH
jgi:hypothetical protein